MLTQGAMFRTNESGRMTMLIAVDDELRRAREEADQADIVRAAMAEQWQSARRSLDQNSAALSAMAPAVVCQMAAMIQQARRIMVSGDSRTLQFQRDLTHQLCILGFAAELVAETTPAAIATGDLLVSISRTGATRTLSPLILKAKEAGVKVIALTARSESRLGRTADFSVVVPVSDETRWAEALFDQASQWLCGALLKILPSRRSAASGEPRL